MRRLILSENLKRYYIDANIFLNPILYDKEKNKEALLADAFLQKLIQNEVQGFTSLLTWDEFVWIIRKTINKEEASKKGHEFLKFPNLHFISVTPEIINSAQNLIGDYNIKPRDAIHLSTALKENIKEIITFDDDFKGISAISYSRPF